MKLTTISIAIAAAALMVTANEPAFANGAFDKCVKKLCVSTRQMDCWVKAGAELCMDDGTCIDLPDHAGARALKRLKRKWRVETQYGTGVVREGFMMIDGTLCPGL